MDVVHIKVMDILVDVRIHFGCKLIMLTGGVRLTFDNFAFSCRLFGLKGSFDRWGWSKCRHGWLLTALMRNNGGGLNEIEEGTCRTPAIGRATQCYNHNVWGSFDHEGTTQF